MLFLPQDGRFLERSLTLAEEAAAFASPNPTVGCVLARGTGFLGEGAHFYDRRDHAEIAAIKAASATGGNIHGATAYITLEPCSHHGRTGPCADALISAGITRCVVATVDPNPLVSGQGIAKLRGAGIEVDLLEPTHPLAQRARRLNDAFAFSIQHNRPFVTLKAAVSRDGKLAPNPAQRLPGAPVWLTGRAARQDVQHLRHSTDAILTGIGTVLADDPTLTDRTGLPRRKPLVRVVLDSHLRTPAQAKLVSAAQDDLLILCTEGAPTDREHTLRQGGAQVVRLPSTNGRLNLDVVMATLAGFRSLLVEGGAILNTSLLSQNFVDKLVIYRAPLELGSDAVPFSYIHNLPDLEQRLTSTTEAAFPNGESEDLRRTGYLHDPWQAP